MKKNVAIITCSVLSLMLSQNVIVASEPKQNTEETETQKDETVYVMLNADGTLQNEIISAWLHNDSGIHNIKEILDIQNIENVKGDEMPDIDGNTYTWNTDGNDVYYRGTSEKQLPVTVSVTYFLDHKEMKPEELLGKSGQLEIHISMKNMISNTAIVEGRTTTIHPLYLAAGVIDLNNDHFTNVACEHGKVLSEGNHQIVTFFTLPGFEDTLKSAGMEQTDTLPIHDTYIIRAEVKDFTMGPIMIAMTPEVPLDQFKDIDSLDELTAGIHALNDAGMQLLDGTKQLSDATSLFADKMKELYTGLPTLQNGIAQLDQGMNQLYDGSNEFAKQMKVFQNGLAQMNEGAAQLYEATSQLPQAADGIHHLQKGAQELNNGIQQVNDGMNALQNQAVTSGQLKQLETVLTTLKGYQPLIKEMGTMLTSLQNLNTSLNVANPNSLPSVSVLATDNANGSSQNVQEIMELCAALNQANADQALQDKCNQITADMGTTARNNAIMNVIINGDGTKENIGMAKQVNAMSEQFAQIDSASLAQLSQQMDAVDQAVAGLQDLEQGITSLTTAMSQINDGSKQLTEGIRQLANSSDQFAVLSAGIQQLYDGTKSLSDGSSLLYQGSLSLNQGLEDAKSGTAMLVNSTPTLIDGVSQLNDASALLAEKTKQLYEGMEAFKTNGLDELSNQVSLSMSDLQFIMAVKDEIIKANEDVHTFSGAPQDAQNKVKYIYKIAEIKQDDNSFDK